MDFQADTMTQAVREVIREIAIDPGAELGGSEHLTSRGIDILRLVRPGRISARAAF